jgi:cytochrome c biogenesis protein CcdA
VGDAPLALAFTLGMVATVNPCGFAMLPAYLSYFLGMEDPSTSPQAGVRRALAVGLAVSTGFLLVFGVMGVLITQFSISIESNLPWFTLLVGIGLGGLGIAMLRGYEPVVRLPKLQKGTNSRQLSSMFLFGVSYAVSSLSCTIPLFLAAVASTFTVHSFGAGLATFLVYGLGMAVVLLALTLAIALARQGLVRSLRGVLPYINRIAGGLLVVAGAYMVYFGWYELRVLGGSGDPGGPASAMFELNGTIQSWVTRTGPLRIGIVLGASILLALLVTSAWTSGRRARR